VSGRASFLFKKLLQNYKDKEMYRSRNFAEQMIYNREIKIPQTQSEGCCVKHF
jgi:hypothetical protein